MELEPKLKLVRPVAEGQFGNVFYALLKQNKVSRKVALKTVNDAGLKQQTRTTAYVNLLRKEGLKMQKLKHVNVVELQVNIFPTLFKIDNSNHKIYTGHMLYQ